MKPKIFISYSHADKAILARLEQHLRVAGTQIDLDIWSDRRLDGGDKILPEIEDAIQSCTIALALVSVDFLNSAFIVREEVPRLLKRRQQEGLRIVGIVVGSCAWDKHDWLANFLMRPEDGKPLPTNPRQADAKLTAIAREITTLATQVQTSNTLTIAKPVVNGNTGNVFENNRVFRNTLIEMSVKFTHRLKDNLTLADVFVPPLLTEQGIVKGSAPFIIEPEKLLDFVADKHTVIIWGEDKSGKTSLANYLYTLMPERNTVPIIVDAKRARPNSFSNLESVTRDCFTAQYAAVMYDAYTLLPKERKAIIIDNFSSAELNTAGQTSTLLRLTAMFEYVIVVTSEMIQLEGVTRPNSDNTYLLAFTCCQIAECTYPIREALIRSWLTIGQDHVGEEDLAHQVRTVQKHLDTISGQNLIPIYPFVVLTIMQALEIGQPLDVTCGTYGYMIQVLITRELATLMPDVPLDTKFTALAELAWYMHEKQIDQLTQLDCRNVSEKYYEDFLVRVDILTFVNVLTEKRVLTVSDGKMRFHFRYYFFYFVARWIAHNLNSVKYGDLARATVASLSTRLHNEIAGNIMLMVSFLSRDPFIIEQLLTTSKSIFDEVPPCDLDVDVQHFSRLSDMMLPESLTASVEDAQNEQKELACGNRVDDSSEPNMEIVKLNAAFKTLQIMGQALRNSAGSLHKEPKLKLARECYNLGLRTLNVFLKLIAANGPEFQRFFAQSLRRMESQRKSEHEKSGKKYPFHELSESDVLNETRGRLVTFTHLAAYSIIRSISCAVGADELKDVYGALLKESPTVAYSLTNACITLDHFRRVNYDSIVELYSELRKNPFSANLLRRMVWTHLLLVPVRAEEKKKLLVGVEIDTRKLPNPRPLPKSHPKYRR